MWKSYIRKKSGISTISTICGQGYTTLMDNLSTLYPQSVDNRVLLYELLRVKTQI